MMRSGFHIDPHRLSVQMMFVFAMMAILTAVAAALPSLWLTNQQLVRQVWNQVEAGMQASSALYTAREKNVIDMATLSAERPCMLQLLEREDESSLHGYLETLRKESGLDMILICDKQDRIIVGAGEIPTSLTCDLVDMSGYYVLPGENGPMVHLLATSSITDEDMRLGQVVASLSVSNSFMKTIREQTGLEQILLVEEQPAAVSLTSGMVDSDSFKRQMISPANREEGMREIIDINGSPYYALRFSLDGGDLEVETALPVGEIIAARERMIWGLAGSVLIIALAGSFLGIFLARQIGKPLADLANAADDFRKGDLDSPVIVETQIREATLLAQALEGARVDLGQTLNKLRQEKAWSDHLLEAFVEGIVTCNSQGKITFFSPGAERITGWSRDQVLNHSCDEFFHPVETKDAFSENIPPLGGRCNLMVNLAGNRQATLSITRARLAPSGVGEEETVLVFRDVSEEQAVHRILGHFMANISHEFRTPLSALAASIELLIDQFPNLTPDELRELLNSLYLGILGLQTLVDNLLESASIEIGHFHVSTCSTDLAQIIDECVMIMHPLIDKHKQTITVALPGSLPQVQADPKRIAQVMINLLSNANKYSPDRTEIFLSATTTDEWIRVSVANRGTGIPAERHKSIFQRFSHLDQINNDTQGGAGLGLSVVKAIVEAHGGEVGVEDHTGGGSVFWFTLPMADRE